MTPLPDREPPWLDPDPLNLDDDIALFHGHHPACPWTIEGDWSKCRCGAIDRAVHGNEPPRLPTDDGNPGTTIALVVLAAIVLLAVVGWWVAVPR